MKKFLLILLPFILAGCTAVVVPMINPRQIYRGYPCGSGCSAFQKGFDSAEQLHLQSANVCRGSTLEEVTGCQAYVLENNRTNPTFTDLTIK